MYQQVKVQLTKSQFDKLRRGQPIQLKHGQIGSGMHWLALHPETAKKVSSAYTKGKGVRICVSMPEMEASGEGLREFLSGLKNTGKWLKKNVIDSSIYQQAIKPFVRKAVDAAVASASPALGPIAPYAQKGVNYIGDQTGAFGIIKKLKRKRVKPRKPKMVLTQQPIEHMGGAVEIIDDLKDREYIRKVGNTPIYYTENPEYEEFRRSQYVDRDFSRLIPVTHPANWPLYINSPIGGRVKKPKKKVTGLPLGGSFKPAGY